MINKTDNTTLFPDWKSSWSRLEHEEETGYTIDKDGWKQIVEDLDTAVMQVLQSHGVM
jgi:hypothetical protein